VAPEIDRERQPWRHPWRGGTDRTRERRDDRRQYEERLTALSDRTPHLLVARDLSAEGLRVDLLHWAEIGSELRISFPVPGAGPPIAVAARVARHDGAHGTLLRFEAIVPEQRDAIGRLLTLLHPLPDGRREGVALAEVAWRQAVGAACGPRTSPPGNAPVGSPSS